MILSLDWRTVDYRRGLELMKKLQVIPGALCTQMEVFSVLLANPMKMAETTDAIEKTESIWKEHYKRLLQVLTGTITMTEFAERFADFYVSVMLPYGGSCDAVQDYDRTWIVKELTD